MCPNPTKMLRDRNSICGSAACFTRRDTTTNTSYEEVISLLSAQKNQPKANKQVPWWQKDSESIPITLWRCHRRCIESVINDKQLLITCHIDPTVVIKSVTFPKAVFLWVPLRDHPCPCINPTIENKQLKMTNGADH